jgi:cold-inducible RNA-binding protein
MNIYVGNLPYEVTEDDLRSAFQPFGQVDTVNIIKDRYTGRSKGFGFVEMPSEAEARAAIGALNGHELKGRTLNVNEARTRDDSGRGGRRPEGRGRGGSGFGGRRQGGRGQGQGLGGGRPGGRDGGPGFGGNRGGGRGGGHRE